MAATDLAAMTEVEGESAAFVRPYSRSWLDWFIDWLEALPGPGVVAWLGLMAISIVVSNAQNWLSGLLPVGELNATQTFWGVFTALGVWVCGPLSTVAGRALTQFAPAISPGVMDLERARYELTTMPARPALVILVVSLPFTLAYYVADPAVAQIAGLTPAALALRGLFEGIFTAITFCLIVQAVRQLVRVRRLHAAADRIDLFHQAPLHAFSQLTAQTGMVLIGLVAFGFAANPAVFEGSVAIWMPYLVGFPLAGILVFIVPLLGMHGRLAQAKADLQGRAEERLKSVLTQLNRDVDALDLARADGLQKTLASVLQQREVLGKLSTWPWSTGTLRAFASAIALPLLLFMMQRMLSYLV
jgi:hypothetical protein